MEPRLVFRTHYQVDEPALLRLLVTSCSSPVRSSYDEAVATKLASDVRRAGKNFNQPAAEYAVDLARGLRLLNDQNVWAPQGHLLALTARSIDGTDWDGQLELDERERLVCLRIFLEGDGAALLFLANHVREHGSIPNSDCDWNVLAQALLLETYESYLKLTAPTADRVALRTEIDRIRKRGYAGKSGAHKLFVHLQSMVRMGLLERVHESGTRLYLRPRGPGHDPIETFLQAVPTVPDLEQSAHTDAWMDLAGVILGVPSGWSSDETHDLTVLVAVYRRITATGIPVCPLSTLIEAFQVEQTSQTGALPRYRDVLERIEVMQRARLRDIRFHVDRRGKPAFIKLSDELLSAYAGSSN